MATYRDYNLHTRALKLRCVRTYLGLPGSLDQQCRTCNHEQKPSPSDGSLCDFRRHRCESTCSWARLRWALTTWPVRARVAPPPALVSGYCMNIDTSQQWRRHGRASRRNLFASLSQDELSHDTQWHNLDHRIKFHCMQVDRTRTKISVEILA